MKFLLRNCTQFKKRLNEGTDKIKITEYPFFCMVLGYMLTKIQDFNLLYSTIQQALALVQQDRLPETEFFQWLIFMYQKPYRVRECMAFLQNVRNEPHIDIYDEIDNLLSSDVYVKVPLAAQIRYQSTDTVVIDNQIGIMRQQKYLQQEKKQIKRQIMQQKEFDMDIYKKMLQDEEMARRLQEQEEKNLREYKSKVREQATMCEICYVDLYDGNPSFLDMCGHGFHQDCLSQCFNEKILNKIFPLKCPNEQCNIQCLESDIKLILKDDLYKKYEAHTLKAYAQLHGDSISWCPTAQCGYMFFYQKNDQVRFQCLECKKQYCLNCRCQWHKDMTCAQYNISVTVSQSDKQFLQFVKGKKFKQCPKCKFWVQKNQGCDHMTCKCKFQFCYKCGGVYMKCQCLQRARQDNQRRLALRQQNRKKRLQRLLKKQQDKKQKQGKESSPPARRGRSKKQSKK